MNKAAAFCPAYLTGIFTIEKGDAAGAGFSIDRGLTTTVSEAMAGSTKILINGHESPAPVSQVVLQKFQVRCGKVGVLLAEHRTDLPIGFGLGMSAAGALSLSLALNELLGTGLTRQECVKIAHDADVECGTGLSGVDAAAIGGILARRSVKDGPVQLPFEEKGLELAFFAPIRTSTVVRSEEWRKKVNAAGEAALASLFSHQDWNGFLAASREFAAGSGLADWCRREMRQNPRASMAMLGQTLFSDMKMMLLSQPKSIMSAKTCEGAAGLV